MTTNATPGVNVEIPGTNAMTTKIVVLDPLSALKVMTRMNRK
jgi:hypothetical protein